MKNKIQISKAKLKNCPFCGNKAKLIYYKKMFAIVCTSDLIDECFYYCGFDDVGGIWDDVITWYASKKDAIKAWNRRK